MSQLLALIFALIACAQAQAEETPPPAPRAPITAPAPATPCQEDEPCWDCETMGNGICGPPLLADLVQVDGIVFMDPLTGTHYELGLETGLTAISD